MMTVARKHFYLIVRISDIAFDEIKDKLDKAGILWKHLHIDEFREEVIVLGSTGLKREQSQF